MLSKRLSYLRKKNKLNQDEMAKKVGVARTTYAMYEQGRRNPDYETLDKLADFFDVDTDYLLGRTDIPKNRVKKTMSEKDERDIAKRMEKIREDLRGGDGLSFSGEPMSEEAIESLLEAIEYAERQTTRINKKYIPKKYRE